MLSSISEFFSATNVASSSQLGSNLARRFVVWSMSISSSFLDSQCAVIRGPRTSKLALYSDDLKLGSVAKAATMVSALVVSAMSFALNYEVRSPIKEGNNPALILHSQLLAEATEARKAEVASTRFICLI